MRTFSNFIIAAVGLLAAGSARASPAPVAVRSALDVYAPPVITPNAQTVWVVGKTFEVTWDTSDAPTQITNPVGSVLLQRGCAVAGDACEQVATLASGFQLLDGSVDVTVPATAAGSDYFIILFGDSGNRSDRFAITTA